jgi:hypothetical protein
VACNISETHAVIEVVSEKGETASLAGRSGLSFSDPRITQGNWACGDKAHFSSVIDSEVALSVKAQFSLVGENL